MNRPVVCDVLLRRYLISFHLAAVRSADVTFVAGSHERELATVCLDASERGAELLERIVSLSRRQTTAPAAQADLREGFRRYLDARLAAYRALPDLAKAKAELVEGMKPGGTAILNADDFRVFAMRDLHDGTNVTYGIDVESDVS